MQKVTLPGTTMRVSRFIFGTASLFNVGLKRNRAALLEAAIEHGFSHFDTAPYYGFGWAEKDLGAVLRRHPSVTVTTKVGIYSAGGEHQSQVSVFFRKASKRLLPALSRPMVDFELSRAKQSLNHSLLRLQRDHVAIYMLHEPQLSLLRAEEWQRWLEDAVAHGRVGIFGLALTADKLLPFIDGAPGLAPIVQVLDSLNKREADLLVDHGRPLQITYGYVSAARASCGSLSVDAVLRAALQRNRDGALIVSTTRAERLAQYARLLISPT